MPDQHLYQNGDTVNVKATALREGFLGTVYGGPKYRGDRVFYDVRDTKNHAFYVVPSDGIRTNEPKSKPKAAVAATAKPAPVASKKPDAMTALADKHERKVRKQREAAPSPTGRVRINCGECNHALRNHARGKQVECASDGCGCTIRQDTLRAQAATAA